MKKAFRIGTISLVFLIIGFQTALLVSRASILYIEAKRDKPDTVYVYTDLSQKADGVQPSNETKSRSETSSITDKRAEIRHEAPHSEVVKQVREQTKKIESFRFNPNTASSEELQRLGFSEKQVASIINYRNKGGKFRRTSDFAKSFVVSEAVYKRLEPYIDIPKIDINTADSLSFTSLPGIGGYYASKILKYRETLGGFSFAEQLKDIIDSERFDGFFDLITCSENKAYQLWSLPADSLKKHPYINSSAASIVLFRDNYPKGEWTIENLQKEGILDSSSADKLSKCNIAAP